MTERNGRVKDSNESVMMLVLFILMCSMRPVTLQDLYDQEEEDSPREEKPRSWFNGDRIVGGENANITDYPYIAQVLTGTTIVGGGTIITKRFIVTAAHLADRERVVAVFVGSGRRGFGTRYEVQMIKHENYGGQNGGWTNDIALLKLQRTLQFSDNVQKIVMAPDTSLDQGPDVEVIGFGTTESGRVSPTLLKAKLRLFPKKECRKFAEPYFSPSIHLCAGNYEERRDSCTGDSGGPLITWSKSGDPVLIGIVSYGATNCTAFLSPGFYTRISSYKDWILDKLQQYGGDNSRGLVRNYGGLNF